MDWNKDHSERKIVVQSDDYSILSMADSHAGGTDNLDRFFKNAETTNTSAVVMDGDLTTGKAEDYNRFENHLSFQDSLPLFLIAGNHDLFNNGWKEFYSRFGSSSYLFTIETPRAIDLFICLDTGNGTLGDKQMGWLTYILETLRPEFRHCIVFTHNNLFRTRHTMSSSMMTEEVDVLIELFTKCKVEMVITGHDHVKDVTLFGNTTYIQIDALKDGVSNAGYLQVRVQNNNIEYEFEKI